MTDPRPRKTILKWVATTVVTAEAPADLVRPMLEWKLTQQLAELNKRGPRWRVESTEWEERRAPDTDWMRGIARMVRLRVRFVAVPDAGD